MLEYSHHIHNMELSLLRARIFNELATHLPVLPQLLLQHLKQTRGLEPETCNEYIRMLPTTEAELITLLKALEKKFDPRELHTAGFSLSDGGEDAPHIGAVYRCFKFNLGGAVFLYRNADRLVYYIRPHKVHVHSQELSLFEIGKTPSLTSILIIAEGEYKALASAQLGYQTVGLNGLQSFTGRHFNKLQKCIKDRNPDKVVLMLDHENKPKWKESPDETGPILIFRLGLRLQEAGVNVRIGLLPRKFESVGSEGWKVDINGALAAGMTQENYDNVITEAVTPLEYIDIVCPEIKDEIKKHIMYVPSPIIIEQLYGTK